MYTLTLTTASPLLIAGQFSSLSVDKATPRRSGEPYIPASALKGALRIEFERLMRAAGISAVCGGPGSSTMQATCDGQGRPCIVCRLFGAEGRPTGALRFHDAALTMSLDAQQTQAAYATRAGVGISRALRRAEPQKLFNQEFALEGLAFTATITLLHALNAEDRRIWERALDWWGQEGLAVGSSRSRGMGRLTFQHDAEPESQESPPSVPTFTPTGKRRLYWLTFTAQGDEPLRVSPQKARPYLLRASDFVPGSTVRGAVGNGLKRRGLPEPDLTALLLNSETRFSHLYPGANGFLQIRPATATQCKLDPEHHGLRDTLLAAFLLRVAETSGNAAESRLQSTLEACPYPNCPGTLKPAGRLPTTNRQMQVKLGLNRQLGRAQDSALYVYEALHNPKSDAGHLSELVFQGALWADEGAANTIAGLEEGALVGGARSKGFGWGTIQVEPFAHEEMGNAISLQNRIQNLNDVLKQVGGNFNVDFASHPEWRNRVFFALLLLTDLALPPGQTLREVLRLATRGWQWEMSALHWARLGGYCEMGNHGKPLVPALERGGVVLLSLPAAQAAALPGEMAQMEREGIGLLRDQGFGWVRGCHEFHSGAGALGR